MEITGSAQHEAWQARVLPPVEQLRPDLWSIPVPIPHNPLRYVSVYAFAVPGGLGLVDTGWNSEISWTALTSGLAGIGADVTDVRGVLVTHLHADHLGLAGRVRAESGAWIAMHPADAAVVEAMNGQDGIAATTAEVDFLVGLGADRSDAVSDVGSPESMEHFLSMAIPDRLLEHGDLAGFDGWQLRAVHTPGHTPGHLCFSEERTGLFFAGDHVLPRISPNISTGVRGEADPLRSYLQSLGGVRDLAPSEVLPAHEWRFTGLADRADQLLAHHEQRLAELLDAVRAHPDSTPWQLAAHLTWSRPWSSYERRMRIFAVTETDAHLRLLASRGLVRTDGGAVPTWTAAAR
ncbi:MBL fold metallo-hydrolase [Modestobacter excelsi]|uniref:MBL fold metallo-hydrolase n=1 Tax=Modestobacter excelsi TaxID=2213161 RepID=UPI001C20DEF2|nr:MBL fold metallo-hydrolase [Modestobacter excelsi]